jgi:hypothetical protein
MFEDQAIDEACISDMDLFALNRIGIRVGHAAVVKRVLRVRSFFNFNVCLLVLQHNVDVLPLPERM